MRHRYCKDTLKLCNIHKINSKPSKKKERGEDVYEDINFAALKMGNYLNLIGRK